jgi:diguanylate cyclase (GGDEF)-like protein
MPIDIPTVYLLIATVALVVGMVALAARPSEPAGSSRIWGGGAFALIGLGVLLVAFRGRIDDWLSIDLGNASVILGTACLWIAARRFDDRPPLVIAVATGPALWILACQYPFFQVSVANRVTLFSGLCVVYGLLAARELFAGREESLRARLPLAGVFLGHAMLFSFRSLYAQIGPTPSVISDVDRVFVLLSIEPIVLLVAVVLLSADLLRERGEKALRHLVETDELTGALSRRATLVGAEQAIREARRARQPVTLVLFDLDHFKSINDQFGHAAGDEALRVFANSARQAIRSTDIFGRIGGEEFAVLLSGVDPMAAQTIADRIRSDFSRAAIAYNNARIEATVSAGLAGVEAGDASFDRLLAAADSALYAAKRDGRDRVTSFALAS